MLNVALIGTGAIAHTFHLPAWQACQGAKLIALCDTNLEALHQAADQFHIEERFTSVDALLDHPAIDIVAICTPNTTHGPIAIQCLEKGKHVIIEKPMATKSDDITTMIALTKKNGCMLMCSQHQRFRPPSIKVKELLEAGELGVPYYIRAQFIKSRGAPQHTHAFIDKQLAGGGSLMDLGSHAIDLIYWWLNAPKVESIRAHCFNHISQSASLKKQWDKFDVEESAVLQISFENNCLLHLETSYLLNSQEDKKEIEIFGSEAGLSWPQLKRSGGEPFSHQDIIVDDKPKASLAQVQHFVDCIHGKETPRIPVQESYEIMKMIEAAYVSALNKKEIRF